ncbi:MAG: DUF4124 domain-containing protein [Burkholderiales bacterium]|nr:DUF4124 domain-containing protein [Burkholderiales bacterium]
MRTNPLWPILTVLIALGASTHAGAQMYQWKDQNGRTVFSDSPPPPNIPPGNIIKAPKPAPRAPAPAPTPAASADPAKAGAEGAADAPKAAAPKPPVDQAAEFRKRQAEQAEAQKKAAETAAENQRKNEQCAAYRSSLATLESGQRVRRTNDKGEPYFLEDNDRAREIERIRRDMATTKC